MQQELVIPYLRATPLHDAHRDLVANSAESFSLRVTVIERDTPDAPLLILTGGLGGPAAFLTIWADYDPGCWCRDYGRPPMYTAQTLWSGWGVPQPGLGAFDFHLDTGVFYSLPRRCGWSVQLVWDGGTKSDLLTQGRLNILGYFGPATHVDFAGSALLTSDSRTLLTSTGATITTS